MARAVFVRDGYHRSILLLLRDRRLIKPIEIRPQNVQQKYLMMRQLADEVVKSGADAAVLIGEVWLSRAEELKPYERPADSTTRTEALSLDMVSKTGEPIDFLARITREGKTISLGDTEEGSVAASFEFASFYQAWGRPIPHAWKDITRATIATPKQHQ